MTDRDHNADETPVTAGHRSGRTLVLLLAVAVVVLAVVIAVALADAPVQAPAGFDRASADGGPGSLLDAALASGTPAYLLVHSST